MSDTPETDALTSVGLENADRECVPADFARKLERERDEARELAQQMSESNQVLQAEVRDYRKTTDKTPPSNNEMHLNLVLQEVAKLAKTLKEERDEAREALQELWQTADPYIPQIDEEQSTKWHNAMALHTTLQKVK